MNHQPTVENYVPIEDFYREKQMPATDAFCDRFAVLSWGQAFRVVASRGEGLSAGAVLPVDPEENVGHLRQTLADGKRVIVQTAVGAAILFGDLYEGGMIPALFPNGSSEDLATACGLLGRKELVLSYAFEKAARKGAGTHSRAVFDLCRGLNETLNRCDRLFCQKEPYDFRLHCAEVAAFAGCRVNTGELPMGDFPICASDRCRWTLFLLCLFLSLRGASAEGTKFRMEEIERQTLTTGMEYRSNRDSRKTDTERFAFLDHPAFEGVELERTDEGYRLAVTLKRQEPSDVLHAISVSQRMVFALVLAG